MNSRRLAGFLCCRSHFCSLFSLARPVVSHNTLMASPEPNTPVYFTNAGSLTMFWGHIWPDFDRHWSELTDLALPTCPSRTKFGPMWSERDRFRPNLARKLPSGGRFRPNVARVSPHVGNDFGVNCWAHRWSIIFKKCSEVRGKAPSEIRLEMGVLGPDLDTRWYSGIVRDPHRLPHINRCLRHRSSSNSVV